MGITSAVAIPFTVFIKSFDIVFRILSSLSSTTTEPSQKPPEDIQVENAFRFEVRDPTLSLLELVRAHPDHSTISLIAITYKDLALRNPSWIDKLAIALVNLKNADIIISNSYGTNPIQIDLALNRQLDDSLSDELCVVQDTSVSPSNPHLIASLLSATTRKNSLCNTRVFIDAVRCALRPWEDFGYEIATHEVLVLGACLQLCISGSYFHGQYGFDPSQILNDLERVKNDGVVKDPQGQRLLEVTIQQARDGFKTNVDGWEILFPE